MRKSFVLCATLLAAICTGAAKAEVLPVTAAKSLSVDVARACADNDPLRGRFNAPSRCLLVHLKTSEVLTASILVTVTFTDESGSHCFDYRLADREQGWQTVLIPMSAADALTTVEIEQLDANGDSISWDLFEPRR